MIKVIFDTNIWDNLETDTTTRETITKLVQAKRVQILVPDAVQFELEKSPFKGIPDFFPVSSIMDAEVIAGHSRAGCARVGNGKVYTSHRNNSNNIKDAIIAATAVTDCDVCVSEDERFRKRLKENSQRCQCLSFDEFKAWLTKTV